jgi:hypothetical protein
MCHGHPSHNRPLFLVTPLQFFGKSKAVLLEVDTQAYEVAVIVFSHDPADKSIALLKMSR